MFLLQEQIIQGTISIWPDDVLGWLQLALAILAVVGGTLGVAWKMIDRKFHHLDLNKTSKTAFDRLEKDVEECQEARHKAVARLDKIDYDIQGLGYKHENVTREISMVNESVKGLEKLVRQQTEQSVKDIRAMSEAVVRLEGVVAGIAGRDIADRRSRPTRLDEEV